MTSVASPVAYLSLLKLRIVLLLLVVTVVTAIVAGEGEVLPGRLALLVLVGSLAFAGSSVLNNYLDRDIDAIMSRTKSRALPSKKVEPAKVLIFGLSLVISAIVIALWLNYLVMLSVISGAFIYVVLYTMWLKRRTSFNIVIGGISGSCAVLVGWFAITSELSLMPFLLALMLFLWTPSHFWSFALVHRESYQRASIPMLPLVRGERDTAGYILLHTVLLLLVSLLLYFFIPLGKIYLSGSLLLGGLFLASGIRLWQQPQRERAWYNYKLSGIYLLGWLLVMAVDVLI